ncbi:MAG: ABC transporter substrate-binding protein [Thermodesulfovibrionales bacterium]
MNNIDDLAILYADDAFSVAVAEGTKKWAERLALKVRYFKGFRKGEKRFDPFLAEARASKAKVLIICGHLEESVQIKRSLERVGWRPIYFATVGPATDRFYEMLGVDAELTFSSSQWESNLSSPISREFYESFLKTYGVKPNYHAATAYAAGQLIEQAIQKAAIFNRERLRKVLSHMEALTIIGRYKVDRSGIQKGHQNFIIQWQGGKREIVWPEPARTARPLLK